MTILKSFGWPSRVVLLNDVIYILMAPQPVTNKQCDDDDILIHVEGKGVILVSIFLIHSSKEKGVDDVSN